MVDVVFYEKPMAPIPSKKSESVLVMFLINRGIVSSEATARFILLLVGLICFTLASIIFIKNINEPPLNTQKVIPPGFVMQS